MWHIGIFMTTKVLDCWYDIGVKGQCQIYLKPVSMARKANSLFDISRWKLFTFCTMIELPMACR